MNNDVRTCRTGGILLALLVLLIGWTEADAKTEITNIVTKVEQRDEAGARHKKVWVVVTYDISDLPQDGVVVNFKATFTDKDDSTAAPFTETPNSIEIEGDLGAVNGDGPKTIEWNAEKTLVRLDKQGRYDCVVELSIEGKEDPTSATLSVRSYVEAPWEYFEDESIAELRNLERTDEFEGYCSDIRGRNWHDSVEDGAVFYKGECTILPRYKGRRQGDNLTGAYVGPGCSSFLAIKDQGTPEEKIWVLFGRFFSGSIPNPSNPNNPIPVDWELQFRYFGRKVDGYKALKAGNGGSPNIGAWVENNQGEDFNLDLDVGNLVEEESQPFELEVVRRQIKYFYQGRHVMSFFTTGDGYFRGTGDANELELVNGDMKINEWLHFAGSFTIDTSSNAATFSSFGAWANPTGDVLWNGPFNAKLDTGITLNDAVAAVQAPQLADKFKIGGFTVHFENLRFLGGVDNASGVIMDLQILIRQLQSGCKYDRVTKTQEKDDVAGILLKGIEMSDDGWDINGVEIKTVSVGIAPGFCIKSFKLNKDDAKNEITGELLISEPKWFDEVGGSFRMKDGKLEDGRIVVSLGEPIAIPYPPLPAPHLVEWKKADLKILNMASGPLTLDGTLTFVNNKDWKDIAKYSGIKTVIEKIPGIDLDAVGLFELNGNAKMVYGQSLSGSVSAKLFQFSPNFWLAEGTTGVEMTFDPIGFYIDGGMKYLNLGGTKWFYEGTGKLGASFSNGFNVSGQTTGDIYLPDILASNGFWAWFNRKLSLPYQLSQRKIALSNLNLWFEQEIVFLGKKTFAVNFGANPITSPWEFCHPVGSIPDLNSRTIEKKGPSIAGAADTTWIAFDAEGTMERFIADVWGEGPAPASVLVDPDGRYFTGAEDDPTVMFYGEERPGQGSTWVVLEPKPGTWKLGVIDKKGTDSTYIFAMNKPLDAFVITSESNGRDVVVTWDGNDAPDESTVELFLDTDEEGVDGTYIGSVSESAGEFIYTLTDSLPACAYYVYGLRAGADGDGAIDYSGTRHDNSKSRLNPPAEVHAISAPSGETTVTWEKSSDPDAFQYAITVTDADGNDSVYATIDFNYEMTTLQVEDWQNKTISVVVYDAEGLRGCPSDPVGFEVLGVDDEPTAGSGTEAGLTTHIAPNPATESVDIFVNLSRRDVLIVELYDRAGRRVETLFGGEHPAGTFHGEYDVTGLESGTYLIRVTTLNGGKTATEKLIVRK